MTSSPQSGSRDIVVVAGRAYLQMVVGAYVLLERGPFWTEKLLLKLVRALYSHRLRKLIEHLPEDVVTEIFGDQDGDERLSEIVLFSPN